MKQPSIQMDVIRRELDRLAKARPEGFTRREMEQAMDIGKTQSARILTALHQSGKLDVFRGPYRRMDGMMIQTTYYRVKGK